MESLNLILGKPYHFTALVDRVVRRLWRVSSGEWVSGLEGLETGGNKNTGLRINDTIGTSVAPPAVQTPPLHTAQHPLHLLRARRPVARQRIRHTGTQLPRLLLIVPVLDLPNCQLDRLSFRAIPGEPVHRERGQLGERHPARCQRLPSRSCSSDSRGCRRNTLRMDGNWTRRRDSRSPHFSDSSRLLLVLHSVYTYQ